MTANSASQQDLSNQHSFSNIRDRLSRLKDLPAMPEMARTLLRLSNNSNANLHDLIKIVEQDPSLTAQLIRYAKSAYFGYRGNIDSIEQAIISVLGFRLSLNVGLGITLGKEFSHTVNGPMGDDPTA